MQAKNTKVVIVGASGYIGGMLISPLARRFGEVRCVSRRPDRLPERLPSNAVAMQGDLLDPDSLEACVEGSHTAYYLAHSLDEGNNYSELERRSAENFVSAARSAGLKRIVYVGALAQTSGGAASQHITSRRVTGEVLRSGTTPVTEFRAPVVIGAGSMPFESVRSLVERLPVMVTPRWVRMPVQPIAAADLVNYLITAAADKTDESHVYEIGGKDVVTYAELMKTYARSRSLRRFMIPVPVITPRLSSLWLKLVTPAHYRIGRRIVDSAAHSSVVRDTRALRDFKIQPLTVEKAVASALETEREGLRFLEPEPNAGAGISKRRIGTRFVERRSMRVTGTTDDAYEAISSVGGPNGWYWGDWLWRLRGVMDRMVGGPGLRRGHSTAGDLERGQTLDFWTVVRVVPGERVTLRADMRLPGEAWLDLRARSSDDGVILDQTVAFDPRGVFGVFYWFALYPLHALVFRGMLKSLVKRASDPTKNNESLR